MRTFLFISLPVILLAGIIFRAAVAAQRRRPYLPFEVKK